MSTALNTQNRRSVALTNTVARVNLEIFGQFAGSQSCWGGGMPLLQRFHGSHGLQGALCVW
eukprot:1190916-Prorocentrum_minimum.AAC.2